MNEWIVHNQNCQIFLWVFNHRFITENKNTGCYGVSHIMLVSRTKSPYGSEVRDENWQWVIVLASCANKWKPKGISVFCKSGEILLKNQVFHETSCRKFATKTKKPRESTTLSSQSSESPHLPQKVPEMCWKLIGDFIDQQLPAQLFGP
jgi:hypothetical protein